MQGLPAGAGMAGGDRDNPWEHFIKQSLAASRGQGHSTANGTASRDSGLGMEPPEYGNIQNLPPGFPAFPGAFLAGFPGMANMSNGFPGFPFGFPAQGFAGGEQSSVTGQRSMKDTGFMAGGNIDFIKMAALVKSRQEQQLKDGTYTGTYGAKNGKPPTKSDMLEEVKKLKVENKEGMEKQ